MGTIILSVPALNITHPIICKLQRTKQFFSQIEVLSVTSEYPQDWSQVHCCKNYPVDGWLKNCMAGLQNPQDRGTAGPRKKIDHKK